ncbi:MAG: threonine dehydratase [Alphaproteobacteria bacterium]|nr:threonine dehydratase [Alphaproteobacteria bacterium]MBV9861944.1 threonine dehydratase [Alphaproteobacteria bacterium]
MTDLAALDAAAAVVRRVVPPTAQYCWPLLSRRLGTEIWVKHENHTPIGAFKLRGGLVYLDDLRRSRPDLDGVVTATRGNHGQSIAYAASRLGLTATIVVPHGNSIEKNRAMTAFGARLIETGHDFQAAYEHAIGLAERERLHLVRSFHPLLVRGVASYGLELFRAVPDLDVVYVPIGLGSGICAVMAAREALGETAEIVGVVAANAPTYALSFAAGRPVATNSADTLADGLACRVPDEAALAEIRRGAARIVRVSEAEIRSAIRILYADTHNLAEGAGAAALAAALQERSRLAGKRVAVILSGGNVDRRLFAEILAERDDVEIAE